MLIVFPLSAFAMDGEKLAQFRAEKAQQDENYKKSSLTDLKKDWYKIQTQFQAEIEGLQALLGEISALESERDNDIKRNGQLSNDRLQKNIENITIKIDKLRNDLKQLIESHQNSFTGLVTLLHNISKTMEDEQIHDDEFIAVWRPLLDCLNQHGIKVKVKAKSSASPSASSTPVTAQAQPLSTLDPQVVLLVWSLKQNMKPLVEECFFPDILAMFNDEKFKIDGVPGLNKIEQHVKNNQEKFSALMTAGKCAYKSKNYPYAFVAFSLIGASLQDLMSEKNRKESAGAAEAALAISQSYLGLMHKNGHGVVANHQEAHKLFQAVAIFLDNYHNNKSSFLVGISEFIVPSLPICDEAVYELSRMHQYGEGVEVNLCKVLCYLDIAAQQGHNIAAHKLKIATDDDGRAQYKQPGFVKFIEFIEHEEKNLAPQDAHTIAKLFIGGDKKVPYLKIKQGYKWLAMAACGGCLDAKYDLAELLLDLGSFNGRGYGCDGLKTSFLMHYFTDSKNALDEHNASVKVIAFCLLSDAAAQGHEKSHAEIVKKFSNQMPKVTLVKPIPWHLKNACARLPWVAKYKFPTLSLASGMDNQILEIFLCCSELPSEVITIILEKIPNFLPEPPKKS